MANKDLMLSASAINLFIEERALWVLKHFFKTTGGFNIYAVRGKVAEEVANMRIENGTTPSFKDYLPVALSKIVFDDVEVSKSDLKDFYKWGLVCDKELQPYEILSIQDKLEGDLFGMPFIGYTDYLVKEDGKKFYLDLKTTAKVPHILTRGPRKGRLPAIKAANVRQQVIYQHITGIPCVLKYINEAGEVLKYPIQDADVEEYLPQVEKVIKKIKKYLTSNIEDVIIDTYPKNMGSFYWDETTREKAKQIWRIT